VVRGMLAVGQIGCTPMKSKEGHFWRVLIQLDVR